jgi:hypothetical protein
VSLSDEDKAWIIREQLERVETSLLAEFHKSAPRYRDKMPPWPIRSIAALAEYRLANNGVLR